MTLQRTLHPSHAGSWVSSHFAVQYLKNIKKHFWDNLAPDTTTLVADIYVLAHQTALVTLRQHELAPMTVQGQRRTPNWQTRVVQSIQPIKCCDLLSGNMYIVGSINWRRAEMLNTTTWQNTKLQATRTHMVDLNNWNIDWFQFHLLIYADLKQNLILGLTCIAMRDLQYWLLPTKLTLESWFTKYSIKWLSQPLNTWYSQAVTCSRFNKRLN